MNVLDYQRNDESIAETIARYERITGRDYGEDCADWFDARVANADCKLHPTSHDLRDVIRQASLGYSVEAELAAVGPEPDDVCEHCNGDGWADSYCGRYAVECACQVVPS